VEQSPSGETSNGIPPIEQRQLEAYERLFRKGAGTPLGFVTQGRLHLIVVGQEGINIRPERLEQAREFFTDGMLAFRGPADVLKILNVVVKYPSGYTKKSVQARLDSLLRQAAELRLVN
jgi:hypothetical protein